MIDRETAVSKSIEYESANCTNCGDVVFVDEEVENTENLPEGIAVVVTGGENMTVDTTGMRVKNYRTPEIVVKIFGLRDPTNVKESYLCPACAASVYDIDTEQ